MKTTIDVPLFLWRNFSAIVAEKKGNRKVNETVVGLIDRVVKGEIKI